MSKQKKPTPQAEENDPWNETIQEDDNEIKKFAKKVLGRTKYRKRTGNQNRRLSNVQRLFKISFDSWKYFVDKGDDDEGEKADSESGASDSDNDMTIPLAACQGKKIGKRLRQDDPHFDPTFIIYDIGWHFFCEKILMKK